MLPAARHAHSLLPSTDTDARPGGLSQGRDSDRPGGRQREPNSTQLNAIRRMHGCTTHLKARRARLKPSINAGVTRYSCRATQGKARQDNEQRGEARNDKQPASQSVANKREERGGGGGLTESGCDGCSLPRILHPLSHTLPRNQSNGHMRSHAHAPATRAYLLLPEPRDDCVAAPHFVDPLECGAQPHVAQRRQVVAPGQHAYLGKAGRARRGEAKRRKARQGRAG